MELGTLSVMLLPVCTLPAHLCRRMRDDLQGIRDKYTDLQIQMDRVGAWVLVPAEGGLGAWWVGLDKREAWGLRLVPRDERQELLHCLCG